MQQDYTINDAYKDGFECGLLYVIRHSCDIMGHNIADEDISKLANHLGSMKPWKTEEEWLSLIRNYVR